MAGLVPAIHVLTLHQIDKKERKSWRATEAERPQALAKGSDTSFRAGASYVGASSSSRLSAAPPLRFGPSG